MKMQRIDRQPEFAARRLQLRPLKASDAAFVARHGNDERIAQMTTAVPFPLSAEAAEDFVSRAQAGDRLEDVWAIDGSVSGMDALLGVISLKHMDRDQSEINYWVAPAFWNRGYAREAIGALVRANPHASSSLVACVFQDNPASARVLTANGFMHLGDAEAFSLSRGCHVPTWTYLKSLG
ncbi:MAG: GNAT family N-acetyltransferase [Rhodobacteraceae bacterium]|nr:GNAT family N-acetyltransferase [Paracoccaceae bacterium]